MIAKKKGTEGFGRTGEEAPAPGDGYAPADWRAMFQDALPLLEWLAAQGSGAGLARQDAARRLIVRHYIAVTSRPGLARARGQAP